MPRPVLLSIFLAASSVMAAAEPTSPPPAPAGNSAPAPAPAVNWVLPIFTDKEGHRSMTLRGSEVRPNKQSVAVTDFSITIFSGDAAAKVDSILLASEAQFFPKDQRASGEKNVRFIRDEIVVTGTEWTYEHGEVAKKVSLRKNVRVTFSAPLNDILK